MREYLLHAIDLAMLDDWEGAKRVLEAHDDDVAHRLRMLITREQERAAQRAERTAYARHEIGNALSIAQANIEAMADGVLAVTPERLNGINEALRSAGGFVTKGIQTPAAHATEPSKDETIDVDALIGHQAAIVEAFARVKGVALSFVRPDDRASRATGNATIAAALLRDQLLDTIRATPPQSTIVVSYECAKGRIAVRLALQPGTSRSFSLPLRADA